MKVNPYDYINEVTDRTQFAGRKEELTIIEEEISRLTSANPISPIVAIVGERRVGKTSLLIQLEHLYTRYGMLGAFVSLTDTTGGDPWEFWREVFDSILIAANKKGIVEYTTQQREFGFLRDRTDQQHSSQRSLKSLQFGKFFFAREATPVIPIQVIMNDLNYLSQCVVEANYQGILLIIDEAHLLEHSREIQQQMRYAKREALKFGIVFAGEPVLSRMFNDASAPLICTG